MYLGNDYYQAVKQVILHDLEKWAPNKPLLEGICEIWSGYPLVYDRSLMSIKGSKPLYEVWKQKYFLDAFVYAHIYRHGIGGYVIAQSYLGFKEFPV
ncbi:hypothetical protein [Fulvivirga sediminis]|uniref:Uncharacterized protein n=1 Tax=Fulvivirga sediminis TaxID=2803949 RepID=A0A937FBQ9_9BACT|nr:hypothetical protein [Fulvivirga sediminis]MBL3658259.1 hypothetical protein [Fulvivirga sediminis]